MKRYFLLAVIIAQGCSSTTTPPVNPQTPLLRSLQRVDVLYQNLPGTYDSYSRWWWMGNYDTTVTNLGYGLNGSWSFYFDSASFHWSYDTLSATGFDNQHRGYWKIELIRSSSDGILDYLNLSYSASYQYNHLEYGLTCQQVRYHRDSLNRPFIKLSGADVYRSLSGLDYSFNEYFGGHVQGSEDGKNQNYADSLRTDAMLTIDFIP